MVDYKYYLKEVLIAEKDLQARIAELGAAIATIMQTRPICF